MQITSNISSAVKGDELFTKNLLNSKFPKSHTHEANALVGQKLSMPAFKQMSGEMLGISYVKVVVEVKSKTIHFMNDHKFKLHAKYMARDVLKISEDELGHRIDEINKTFYYGSKREYYLGIVALNQGHKSSFFTLETVEVDDMNIDMLTSFYKIVRENIPFEYPLYLRPANHYQEEIIADIPKKDLPRVFTYEVMQTRSYIPLNVGQAKGRIRYFSSADEYDSNRGNLKWFDIIVMKKVPDNIPRLSGIINAAHTTPLSHTNVLACGWQIPNAIQIGIEDLIKQEQLNGEWVHYTVDKDARNLELRKIDALVCDQVPPWKHMQVVLDPPDAGKLIVSPLNDLRMDNSRLHGTKAANLGEVNHLLKHQSKKVLGFYSMARAPRPHLLDYLKQRLIDTGVALGDANDDLTEQCFTFLKKTISVPRGLSLPFAFQRKFLESSPQIQQIIGKLKMALELDAHEIEPLCIKLQQLIIQTKIPQSMKKKIVDVVKKELPGIESFVVRSSSNAEDLQHFSAAGIYESYNHITDWNHLFKSIKAVWASLVSPRSVRLRQDVNISLDDCYMGVIIQEEVQGDLGGVMVTTNPMNPKKDFRNVCINASTKSAVEIVEGIECSYQILFNVVEGQGRTIGRDNSGGDLTRSQIKLLSRLALAGKLLESHFCPDQNYTLPVDIEWAINGDIIYLLQIRPYSFE